MDITPREPKSRPAHQRGWKPSNYHGIGKYRTGKEKIGNALWSYVGIVILLLIVSFLSWQSLSKKIIIIISMEQRAANDKLPVYGIGPTQTTLPKPGIGSKQISAKDGMVMVFVPEGIFQMGSNYGPDYEKPKHTVWLDAFWIDQTEVNNTQFEKFVKESHYETDAEFANWSYVFDVSSGKWPKVTGANWRHPQGLTSILDGLENHPVAYMSWNDASAYCRWAGRRLPSEAEWEKAARGTDNRIYPWGNQKPDGNLLNFADKNITLGWADKDTDDGYSFTSPVGHYPEGASPYGALDMAGNVWEWVNDWFDLKYYLSQTIWRNPTGPSVRPGRVLRGGSWYDSGNVTRSSFRLGYFPMDWYAFYGFRCAVSQ